MKKKRRKYGNKIRRERGRKILDTGRKDMVRLSFSFKISFNTSAEWEKNILKIEGY